MAIEEGALHARHLAVSIPYHSGYLKDGALEFAKLIRHLEILSPKIPIISMIDQVSLSEPEIIRMEIIRNLYHPLNWFQTMKVLLIKNIARFIECGPGKSLAKNSKFIEGNYRFYSLNAIPQN